MTSVLPLTIADDYEHFSLIKTKFVLLRVVDLLTTFVNVRVLDNYVVC